MLPALLVEGGPELQSPRLHSLFKKVVDALNPRQRQEEPCEFQASQDCTVRPCLKTNQQNTSEGRPRRRPSKQSLAHGDNLSSASCLHIAHTQLVLKY